MFERMRIIARREAVQSAHDVAVVHLRPPGLESDGDLARLDEQVQELRDLIDRYRRLIGQHRGGPPPDDYDFYCAAGSPGILRQHHDLPVEARDVDGSRQGVAVPFEQGQPSLDDRRALGEDEVVHAGVSQG